MTTTKEDTRVEVVRENWDRFTRITGLTKFDPTALNFVREAFYMGAFSMLESLVKLDAVDKQTVVDATKVLEELRSFQQSLH